APTGDGRGGGADGSPFLALGQAPGARVCAGYGDLSSATVWAEGSAARCAVTDAPALRPSLVPLRLAPYYCGYYPGVGHHAHPAALQAGLRPTSDCPCPCSPSNV